MSHTGKQFTNHCIPPRSTLLKLEKIYLLCLLVRKMSTPIGQKVATSKNEKNAVCRLVRQVLFAY